MENNIKFEEIEIPLEDFEEALTAIQQKKKMSAWEDYTPLVKDKNGYYNIFISNEIVVPFEYNRQVCALLTAEEGDVFYLHLNTPGGMNDGTYFLTSAMTRSKAKIIGVLSGTVASNGTVLTMYCDDIIVDDNTQFMIHEERGGYSGTFSESKAYNEFKKTETPAQFKRDYLGFLTEEEIDDVLDGKDMWMNADEVRRRWEIKKNS